MKNLTYYKDFKEKNERFINHFQFVKSEKEFDLWYSMFHESSPNMKTSQIFRGLGEAKYKLYNSAQRYWIENDINSKLSSLGRHKYLNFLTSILFVAKQDPLLKKVFQLYNYDSVNESEFPLLSLMQHYSGITPLQDWTYNVDIALYFATEKHRPGAGMDDLDDYFSIYMIWKPDYLNELQNIVEIFGYLPPLSNFNTWDDDSEANVDGKRMLCYISDFDEGNSDLSKAKRNIEVRNPKPLTLLFNQNIIAQEGLFIFNPFSTMPLEDVFLSGASDPKEAKRFRCFNIKKGLIPYIKNTVLLCKGIDKSYVYPNLDEKINLILESAKKTLLL